MYFLYIIEIEIKKNKRDNIFKKIENILAK
jgi:hypothetical protein